MQHSESEVITPSSDRAAQAANFLLKFGHLAQDPRRERAWCAAATLEKRAEYLQAALEAARAELSLVEDDLYETCWELELAQALCVLYGAGTDGPTEDDLSKATYMTYVRWREAIDEDKAEALEREHLGPESVRLLAQARDERRSASVERLIQLAGARQ